MIWIRVRQRVSVRLPDLIRRHLRQLNIYSISSRNYHTTGNGFLAVGAKYMAKSVFEHGKMFTVWDCEYTRKSLTAKFWSPKLCSLQLADRCTHAHSIVSILLIDRLVKLTRRPNQDQLGLSAETTNRRRRDLLAADHPCVDSNVVDPWPISCI
jgi:hypothetical protein